MNMRSQSGTTWVRHLLSQDSHCPQLAVHTSKSPLLSEMIWVLLGKLYREKKDKSELRWVVPSFLYGFFYIGVNILCNLK
jgi:hypothetical protein